MKKLWIRSAALSLALVAPACGDDGNGTPGTDTMSDVGTDVLVPPDLADEDTSPADTSMPDTSTPDTTQPDTSTPDTSETDTSTPDTSETDTSTPDTSTPDTSESDTSTPDTTEADTSTPDTTGTDVVVVPTSTLAELLLPFDGSANGLETTPGARVEGLTVTTLKPVVGTENGGFFVQEGATGPAIFVEFFDGATATVAAGDVIAITIGRIVNFEGLVRVRAFADVAVTSSGANLDAFYTDVSTLSTATAYNALQSRAIELEGLITTNAENAGGGSNGYVRFGFTSVALTDPAQSVRLRIPRAIFNATGLETDCLFSIAGAMWGYRGNDPTATLAAQPSTWDLASLDVVCAPPSVVSATAPSATEVQVVFSRPLDADALTSGAFVVTPALDVTAVTLSSDRRTATLTTAEQTPEAEYLVTVANTVVDVLGEPVDETENFATFTGFGNVVAANKLLFCFEDDAGTFILTPTVSNGFTEAVFDRVTGGSGSSPTSVTGNRNWESDGTKRQPAECIAGTADSNTSKAPTGASWPTTALDPATASYFRLRFKAPAGTVSISFDATRSSSGPAQIAVWNSGANALVGDVLAVSAIGTAFGTFPMFSFLGPVGTDNVALQFQIPDSTTTPFEVRFYPHAASQSGGTFRMDNLTVTHTAPTE